MARRFDARCEEDAYAGLPQCVGIDKGGRCLSSEAGSRAVRALPISYAARVDGFRNPSQKAAIEPSGYELNAVAMTLAAEATPECGIGPSIAVSAASTVPRVPSTMGGFSAPIWPIRNDL